MKTTYIALFFAAVASAQAQPANPLVGTAKGIYALSKGDVMGSFEKVPEDLWKYRPVETVRTFGELFAHIADAQYEFCGVAKEGKSVKKDIEKNAKSRTEVGTALKEAFGYCDATFAEMTDANAAETVKFIGMTFTKLGVMDLNTAHNMEHYGNLVTYMRMKNIVPPSSTPKN